jgi:hypothetical protein
MPNTAKSPFFIGKSLWSLQIPTGCSPDAQRTNTLALLAISSEALAQGVGRLLDAAGKAVIISRQVPQDGPDTML